MSKGLPWLTSVDMDILRLLDRHDVVYTPRTIHDSMKRAGGFDSIPSYSQTSRRVRALTDAGLLERFDDARGRYCLSSLGRRYLDDDLDSDEREELASLEPEY